MDEDTAEDSAAFTDPSEIETQEEYMAVVYNFVSWVQDSLMLAMVCLDLALVISLLMVQTYAAAVRSADVASGIWPLPSSRP